MDGINQFNHFIALHKAQLLSSGVPQHFWSSLYRKLTKDIFDAGEALQLMLIDYEDENDDDEVDPKHDGQQSMDKSTSNLEERPVFMVAVARERGIQANDPNAIYLIDHAWTFRWNTARQQLEQLPELTNRMCAITGVDLEHQQRVDKVLTAMWKYCHAYTISREDLDDQERMPIWYIMDEVGSAVNHSDDPNFRLVPFIFLDTQITYSLLFPVRDSVQGEPVTRDYVEYVDKQSAERVALSLPWRTADLRHIPFAQSEPDADYFSSGHILESYAQGEIAKPKVDRSRPLRIYAEYDVLRQYLTAPCFLIVENEHEADVLWLTRHFKSFEELSLNTPNKFVNQFPFEYVITIKDLLSIICRRTVAGDRGHHNPDTLETFPSWLPTTYNLKTELLQFASYYQHRRDKGLDNHWIVKPWNLARGLDTHITDSIAQIVRLPATGPKIAQKYIYNPVLFYRAELEAKVKFDIRYVILLKSVEPLEAYIHRKFYLRFANKAFSLDTFDDYQKHFTVMNYQNEAGMHHVKCENFLFYWREQYPNYPWCDIEDAICGMLHEMLTCAAQYVPPRGIAPCPQSRALYAADIMLEWTRGENKENHMQPKLLEVNWTPDCQRACEYYPEFFNDIFKLLFLDESNDESFRLLDKKN